MFVIPLLTACCLAAVTSIIKLMKDKEDLTSKMVRCGKSLNEVTNISLAINDENYVFFYDVNKLTIHDMAIEFCANNGTHLSLLYKNSMNDLFFTDYNDYITSLTYVY